MAQLLQMGVELVAHISGDVLRHPGIDKALNHADAVGEQQHGEGGENQPDEQLPVAADQPVVHDAACQDRGEQVQHGGDDNQPCDHKHLDSIGLQIGENAPKQLPCQLRRIFSNLLIQRMKCVRRRRWRHNRCLLSTNWLPRGRERSACGGRFRRSHLTVVGDNIFIVAVLHSEPLWNDPQLLEPQLLIQVDCRGVGPYNRVELQNPIPALMRLPFAVQNQFFSDMLPSEFFFDGIACVADVSTPAFIIWMKDVQADDLVTRFIVCDSGICLFPEESVAGFLRQAMLLWECDSFVYNGVPDLNGVCYILAPVFSDGYVHSSITLFLYYRNLLYHSKAF